MESSSKCEGGLNVENIAIFNRLRFLSTFSASSKGLLFKQSGATTWTMVFSWIEYPYGMKSF